MVADMWQLKSVLLVENAMLVPAPSLGYVFFDAELKLWNGFESFEAAQTACRRVQEIWDTSHTRPAGLYVPFLTESDGWGFFDRAGELHATFPLEGDAWEAAIKQRRVTA